MATRTWGNYQLERFEGVGGVGFHHTGTKVHWVQGERVVGYVGDWKPGPRNYKIGDVFSCGATCNSNGQHVARLYPNLSVADITCRRCKPA